MSVSPLSGTRTYRSALTFAHFCILFLRNLGIIIAFAIGLTVLYITASEFISEGKSKGEVKLYPRTRVPKESSSSPSSGEDLEASAGAPGRKPDNNSDHKQAAANIPASSADFSFENLCYDIPVKSGTRRLLDNVDGWVKVSMVIPLRCVQLCPDQTCLLVLSSPALLRRSWEFQVQTCGRPRLSRCTSLLTLHCPFRRWQDNPARRPCFSCHHGRDWWRHSCWRQGS